ncbi:alpha/beta hydrolase [Tellurirhabdus rosea]|uniref:alpha/beta hydrolase n=1 Tax=Tellurirhabdus rosea TaxID=2674997 RepID=UPI0022524722|nr:alpha/beta fold hydrolase [Tellurirhabdus rosea]
MSFANGLTRRAATVGAVALIGYIAAYGFLYTHRDEQTRRYRSVALPASYRFQFAQPVEEHNFPAAGGGLLNALLFKAPRAKGVVCFWKGNGGTLANWGAMAPTFLQFGYDVLITDYRQHGKSRGAISLQNFKTDAQTIYDSLRRRYREEQIVLCGYSLGGRIAAYLASQNRPKMTILIDPASAGGDFSDRVTDLLYFPLPSVTGFVFSTEEDVQTAPSTVVVLSTPNRHSTAYGLVDFLRAKDRMVILPQVTHETILTHPQTIRVLGELLQCP